MSKPDLHTQNQHSWKIDIDTGGTFTDCLATGPTGKRLRMKVLSSARIRGTLAEQLESNRYKFKSSWQFQKNMLTGFQFQLVGESKVSRIISIDSATGILEMEDGFPNASGRDFELFTGEEAPVLAARLITGTPLHQPLPSIEMRLGTTKGTNALLERKGAKTLLVVTKGFRDLLYIGTQQRPSLFQLNIPDPSLLYADVMEVDERLAADGSELRPIPEDIHFPDLSDYESVAVSFLHAGRNDAHETAVASLITNKIPFVSSSTRLSGFSHYLRRTQTAVVNAYLAPVLHDYIENIKTSLGKGSLQIMTSAGSLSNTQGFLPKDSLLSGPAGGMIATANMAKQFGFPKVLTFDMGGTSTDVARIDPEPTLKYTTEIDRIEFHNPTLDIETVAAGGGSICYFDGFSLHVGPQSAGASPGPACYGAGGPLTVTDVNLLLGKMDPAGFGIPVRTEAARAALKTLQQDIENQTGNQLKEQEILLGLEKIANEKMADAIRKISVQKGIDPSEYALVTFGGAGGLHSCQLAELLDIDKVIVPYDAGLFSAVGIGHAVISTLMEKQVLQPWSDIASTLESLFNALTKEGKAQLKAQNIHKTEVGFTSVFMRLLGQENTIEVAWQGAETLQSFQQQYTELFGYYPHQAVAEVESVRVQVRANSTRAKPFELRTQGDSTTSEQTLQPTFTHQKIPVFEWEALHTADQVTGPAVVSNTTSTTFIPAGWRLVIQENKDALLFRDANRDGSGTEEREEIAFQLFTNRFSSIADEMGVQLQRTAFSVNVKERLDFSCALLDTDGELLVNAQHIPVHLGSMGICGRLVLEAISIGPGDVVITNHPKYGGSHLPDVTLMSGVFQGSTCIGYVINRAHHAEIGGKTPGSMPPDATCLAEEGVVIPPRYLVKNGLIQQDALYAWFTSGPYPTRSYASNEADILAALSSLRKGSDQLLRLVDIHGHAKVRKYMKMLKENAALQLELAMIPYRGQAFIATESLDDGHEIAVKISIGENLQTFDFTGTSPRHPHNLNANISILYSAILYVMRLVVNKEVPLNDGLMKNVKIILPDNTFLHPDFSDDPELCPAVVGGNTEVSQRLVDTLLKAFGLVACSQGTMNNFLFGNERFGYYETIGGGTGAGNGFHGRSAVHQHMTNTRITDPEQLEASYPVRLLEFGIRKESGGNGQFRGGDGIVRKIEFLEPLQVTLVTQHRKFAPYGLQGGEAGSVGRNLLQMAGLTAELPGVTQFLASPGQVLTILTPGGGGFEIGRAHV